MCSAVYRCLVAYIFHATNGEEITVHATEIANNKITSQLANTRRENIFSTFHESRARVARKIARKESRLYHGRFTDSFCEKGRANRECRKNDRDRT